jgi:thiol-disulfide isomerase/thioredoxin
MKVISNLLALLLAFCASVAMADEINVGDKAPAMQVAKWVKGGEVSSFAKDRIYVVEFWATWCGPCRESIPHLTELAKKFSNVTFVGVSVWEEREPKDTSYFSTVEAFVEEMGAKMDYVVGIDGPKGEMAATWMEAAGQNGIPAAFIVNGGGIIVWIGHPMSMDGVLEKVVAGEWDLETAKTHAKAEREMNELMDGLYREWQEAIGDKQKLTAFVERLDKTIAEKPGMASQLVALKFDALLPDFPEQALATARKYIAGELKDDVDFLITVAMGILENDDEKMDYAVALEAVRRAIDIDGMTNPFMLDMLAMAHYKNKNYPDAIIVGEKALSMVEADIKAIEDSGKEPPAKMKRIAEYLTDRLEMYRKKGKS